MSDVKLKIEQIIVDEIRTVTRDAAFEVLQHLKQEIMDAARGLDEKAGMGNLWPSYKRLIEASLRERLSAALAPTAPIENDEAALTRWHLQRIVRNTIRGG